MYIYKPHNLSNGYSIIIQYHFDETCIKIKKIILRQCVESLVTWNIFSHMCHYLHCRHSPTAMDMSTAGATYTDINLTASTPHVIQKWLIIKKGNKNKKSNTPKIPSFPKKKKKRDKKAGVKKKKNPKKIIHAVYTVQAERKTEEHVSPPPGINITRETINTIISII